MVQYNNVLEKDRFVRKGAMLTDGYITSIILVRRSLARLLFKVVKRKLYVPLTMLLCLSIVIQMSPLFILSNFIVLL